MANYVISDNSFYSNGYKFSVCGVDASRYSIEKINFSDGDIVFLKASTDKLQKWVPDLLKITQEIIIIVEVRHFLTSIVRCRHNLFLVPVLNSDELRYTLNNIKYFLFFPDSLLEKNEEDMGIDILYLYSKGFCSREISDITGLPLKFIYNTRTRKIHFFIKKINVIPLGNNSIKCVTKKNSAITLVTLWLIIFFSLI